jgi:hypothetical protein
MARNAERGPRRDGERDQQGEEHRRGGPDRDRPHVGPHQAADKRHGQDGGDDGPGGEDRRVADLADGLDGDWRAAACGSAPGRRWWRTMFSTTTIASSTRMPIEKISAKSVMRFSV